VTSLLNASVQQPERRGRTERTFANWLWMSFATGAQAVLTLATVTVLAHLLTPKDFGLIAASLLVIRLSLIFSQSGIDQAVVQRPVLRNEHVQTAALLSVALGGVLLLLLWVLAPLIATAMHVVALTPIVRALAWTLPVQGASAVAEALLRRELEFRAVATIRVISYAVGYGGVAIAIALLGGGVWALVSAQIAQVSLYTALLLIRRRHSWGLRIGRQELRELLSFGGGLTLARLGNYAALNGDYLVVVNWIGVTALGLYERAYQLMAMPATLVGQVLDDVLFPAMAQIQHELGRMAGVYRRAVGAVALVTLPLTALVVVLAPELVDVLLGPRWSAATLPFQILALGTLFRTSYKISDSLTRAVGAVYARAWRQWVYAALVFGGAIVGQTWGIAGVATGVLFALIVNFLFMAHLSTRLVGLGWRHFAAAHAPGLRAAVVIGLPAYAAATGMRTWLGAGSAAVLAAALAATAVVGTATVALAPDWLLGSDGIWLLRRIADFTARRMRRVPPAARVTS
jgi:PST family polysaccharide transporter